jgi:hypothetical protein
MLISTFLSELSERLPSEVWSSFCGAADVFPSLFYLLIILYFGQIELVINSVQKRGKDIDLFIELRLTQLLNLSPKIFLNILSGFSFIATIQAKS